MRAHFVLHVSTHYVCMIFVLSPVATLLSDSRSFVSLSRVNASNTPFHASRSTRSSCSPRFLELTPSVAARRPAPRVGGTKPGGGASIAEGAIRDCRMCANEERMVSCIDYNDEVRIEMQVGGREHSHPSVRNIRLLPEQTVLIARRPVVDCHLTHPSAEESEVK